MSDLISRQAAIDAMYALCNTDETLKENPWRDNPHIDAITDAIEDLPSVNPLSKDYNTIYYTPQPKTGYWISVSERLPDDFGTYLITLENGDVCKCEFNPDFIDEEHENGAFTYYHQYFDNATLAIFDEEEEAVDAIAWMPFEPYEP